MNAASEPKPAARPDRNAIAVLKDDHRRVAMLFQSFESALTNEEKTRLAQQICNELLVHTMIEEEIFYPACREAGVQDEAMDEAQVEHDTAKVLIAGLLRQRPGSPFYDARMSVLAEYVMHHFSEEEYPASGIFARARAAKLDLLELGRRLKARRAELLQLVQRDDLSPTAPRSLEFDPTNRDLREQQTMGRLYDRDLHELDDFKGEDEHGSRRSRRERREFRDKRSSTGANGHDSSWFGKSASRPEAERRGNR
jgi:hypothetical protein